MFWISKIKNCAAVRYKLLRHKESAPFIRWGKVRLPEI